jgi:hypothetical protein
MSITVPGTTMFINVTTAPTTGRKMHLKDRDIINQVNLKFISEHYGYAPGKGHQTPVRRKAIHGDPPRRPP